MEKALLKRALGFTHKEVQTEEMFDKETGEVLSTGKRRVVSKEVLPDVRALLFWLKNRRPARWRERIEPPGRHPGIRIRRRRRKALIHKKTRLRETGDAFCFIRPEPA